MKAFLDHASATPLHPRVFSAMKPYLKKYFANSSAIYSDGVSMKKILEDCRTKIARMLVCQTREIIFTGGGTESDNMAILGTFEKAKENGVKVPHIITTSIEHPAVLETCAEIERRGGRVTYVKPEKNGIVRAENLVKEITPDTVLVSMILAQNEIGTIQPVRDVFRLIDKKRKSDKSEYPYLHTDASQAPNYLEIDMPRLGVDMITLDGAKIYGPKGVGILVKKHEVQIKPIMFGGGQEYGLRSGTENIPLIVGVTEALRIANSELKKESARLKILRDELIGFVLEKIPGSSLNGDRENRLPNNANFCFPGKDSEFLAITLDQFGIAVSPGSACQNISDENSSYVLEAMGKNDCAKSSLRFSLGRGTNRRQIKYVMKILEKIYS